MVFYFTTSGGYVVYMGRDKFENEDLIRYHFPEDIWFHVDNYSSAHVYLRLKKGETLDDVPHQLIFELANLVTANSIEGCKKSSIDVVYTPADNLHKTNGMEVGAVGYHDRKAVRSIHIPGKDSTIVKALNKTKSDDQSPDFAELLRKREQQTKQENARSKKSRTAQEKKERREREEAAKLRNYDSLFEDDSKMTGLGMEASVDASAATGFEDDFM